MAAGTSTGSQPKITDLLQKFAYEKKSRKAIFDDEECADVATCSNSQPKASCTSNGEPAASDEEEIGPRRNRLKRVYQIKDSDDSEESSNECNGRHTQNNCDNSSTDFKSKIKSSFLKNCDNSSLILSQRIQNAFNNISTKSKSRALIRSSSEDEEVSPSRNGCEGQNSASKEMNDFGTSDQDILYKESCLSKLCRQFPKQDSMDIQDALVQSSWVVEKASEIITKLQEDKKGNGLHKENGDNYVSLKRLKNFKNVSAKKKRRTASSESGDDDSCGVYSKEEELFDSDASDVDVDDTLTPARKMVVDFLETASLDELTCIPHCSVKKAECIIQSRPFTGWLDLITKLQTEKNLSTDLIKSTKNVLNSRKTITKLMKKCEVLAEEMEQKVSRLMNTEESGDSTDSRLKVQPSLLNSNCRLSSYQLLGLNWLILMHKQNVNGILADEMGLGKTIQAIAFLTYCMESGNPGPFLIVVPSSTLDNWAREINTWSPTLKVQLYHGNQEYRRFLRTQLIKDNKLDFNILLSSYNLVAGAAEDKVVFKKLYFDYVVFDEAHLLKNMETLRYQCLMKVNAKRRLLLTGTPLQNNLLELISLLGFLMPNMFVGKIEHLKLIFSMASKKGGTEIKNAFEKERVDQAKRIMKPFVLRRQKTDVLKELPNKVDNIELCELSQLQRRRYNDLVETFSKEVQRQGENVQGRSGSGMMMQLRKLANHPLLMRYKYSDSKLKKMAKLMLSEPTHREAVEKLVLEDMQVMSDFELHNLCNIYKSLQPYRLQKEDIMDSGKFQILNKILPEMRERGDRLLLFSQFVIVLDIIQEFMNLNNYKFLRLDGSTPVEERQGLIDEYTNDKSIFAFLLSTRAGGLGINLVAANVVVLHDIDFNPYNDKQAVDRCHRVGQTRDVKIIRLVSKDTIEENILKMAQHKLKLEKALIDNSSDDGNENMDVASLLKEALGLS